VSKRELVDCVRQIVRVGAQRLQIVHVHVMLLKRLARRKMKIAGRLRHQQVPVHLATLVRLRRHHFTEPFALALRNLLAIRKRPATLPVRLLHLGARVAALLLHFLGAIARSAARPFLRHNNIFVAKRLQLNLAPHRISVRVQALLEHIMLDIEIVIAAHVHGVDRHECARQPRKCYVKVYAQLFVETGVHVELVLRVDAHIDCYLDEQEHHN
jgi:hypothetical protein